MVLPVSSEVEWGGLHGLQVENLESTRSPSGIHLEPDNNLAGLPAKKIPPGLHVENVESWIPPGFHLESMGEGKVLIFVHVLRLGLLSSPEHQTYRAATIVLAW